MADSEAQGAGGIFWWSEDEQVVISGPGVVVIANTVGAVAITSSAAGCQVTGNVGGVVLS